MSDFNRGMYIGLIFGAMVAMLSFLAGEVVGRNANMRYGKCVAQVVETRYVCTDQSSHGACIAWGLRPVPLCLAWEK